jgi:hypothetical protein
MPYSFFPVAAHSPTRPARSNNHNRSVAFAGDTPRSGDNAGAATATATGFGVFGLAGFGASAPADGDDDHDNDDMEVEVDDFGDRVSVEPMDDGDDEEEGGGSTPPAAGLLFGWLAPAPAPAPAEEAVPAWFSTATRQDSM